MKEGFGTAVGIALLVATAVFVFGAWQTHRKVMDELNAELERLRAQPSKPEIAYYPSGVVMYPLGLSSVTPVLDVQPRRTEHATTDLRR